MPARSHTPSPADTNAQLLRGAAQQPRGSRVGQELLLLLLLLLLVVVVVVVLLLARL